MAYAVVESLPAHQAAAGADRHFFAVPLAVLAGLPELQCDLFVQDAASGRKLLYRAAKTATSLAGDHVLEQRNVRHLYLRAEDRERFDQAMRASLAAGHCDAGLRLALTIEHHRDAFQVAMASRNAAPIVAQAEQIAGDLLQVVHQDDFS